MGLLGPDDSDRSGEELPTFPLPVPRSPYAAPPIRKSMVGRWVQGCRGRGRRRQPRRLRVFAVRNEKGRMAGDLPGGLVPVHGQAKDVLVRDAGPGHLRASSEAEALIQARITHEDTPLGIAGIHDLNARFDQYPPDPPALMVRMDRHRSHDEPAGRRVADPGRRERNVTHHRAVHLGYNRQFQSAVPPQRVDDQGLRATAVRVTNEGQADQLPDGVDIGRLLKADPDHPANLATIYGMLPESSRMKVVERAGDRAVTKVMAPTPSPAGGLHPEGNRGEVATEVLRAGSPQSARGLPS